MVTELLLENTLSLYEPAEIVSLLSCFVFQEKTEAEPLLTPRLKEGLAFMIEITDKVDRTQDRWKVGTDADRFGGGRGGEARLKSGLMEVVYEWARGMVSPTNFQALLSGALISANVAFCRDHGAHRRGGGYDCSLYHSLG